MKMKPEDFAYLWSRIAPLDTEERREQYRTGDYPRADRTRDLNRRYRWDLLWATGIKIGDGVGIRGDVNLYAYLDDSHIDTALRQIVKPL